MVISHTTPPSKLRLLILDDNPDDIALFLLRLTREGWEFDHIATNQRAEFVRLIKEQHFDVILSDYSLGDWNGLDAIEILKHEACDIPLILVTGTMGEELAVECIHQGAADFILKDSLSRLPFAIRRACKEHRLMTEKRLMDNELQVSEQRFRLLVDGVRDYAICFLDPAGRVVSWNVGAERITGYDENEILGQPVTRFYLEYERTPENLKALLEKARQEGKLEHEGWRLRKDGSRFWAHSVIAPVVDDHGEFKGYSKVLRDITERQRIEAEMRRNAECSFAQQSALADLVRSDAIKGDELGPAIRQICEISALTLGVERVSFWRYTTNRTLIQCLELYELSSGQHTNGGELQVGELEAYFNAIGNTNLVAIDDAQNDPQAAELKQNYLIPRGITSMMDVPVYLNGRIEGLLCHEHVGPKRQWQSDERTFSLALANVVSLVLDQHERRLTEYALKESENRFQQLASVVQQVFWMTSPDGSQYIYVSPAFERVWGRSCDELLAKPAVWVESIHPEDRARMRRAINLLSQGMEYNLEFRIVRMDGDIRWIRDRGFPIRNHAGQIVRSAGVAEDITQHKQLEAQFLQAQKMESIGRLAGGVAHDFNNMLTAIRSFALLARDGVGIDSQAYKDLEQVLEATTRAEGVTRRLLAFARQQVFRPEVIEPNGLLENLNKMLARLIREDVDLQLVRGEGVGRIKADPSQLEQMIINLVVNAVDAMPAGGTLTISTAGIVLQGEEVQRLDLPAGRYVLLQVTDTGVGMSEEVKAHVFEPFFTTKPTGSGTGLGLATVYGIVRQTGGNVFVESEVGKGTTFSIYLPETIENLEAKSEMVSSNEGLRGSETILVAEDEPTVRHLIVKLLKAKGYTVIEAGNGEEALKLVTLLGKVQIDLVLTDLIMPRMGGKELAERLREMRPKQPILFISGYSREFFGTESKPPFDAVLLSKPFAPEPLLRAVRTAIDTAK
jgi:PAS domain S-box-containing protein